MDSPFACQHESLVEGCPSCAELAAIERAFAEDRHALMQEAQVPSSAIVWWRAQMRSRREAQRLASEPITVVQGLALACAAGVLFAIIGFLSPALGNVAAWITGASLPTISLSLPAMALPEQPMANPILLAAMAALGLTVVVLPVVLYFTFHEGE